MSTYFFHLHECGITTSDHEGSEHASMESVREEACRAARAIMYAEVTEGRLCLSCAIEVTDVSGDIVLTLPFKEAVTVSGI